MKLAAATAALMIALAAPAHATDVATTRFHTAESLAAAAPGPIAVRAGAGLEPDSIEARVWTDAVAAALARQGFTIVPDAARVAVVTFDQVRSEGDRPRANSGVSVGVGVGSGGYYGGWGRRGGTNLGLGLGFTFGGKGGGEALDTTLGVTIEGPGGTHAWEGRAEARVRARSRGADPQALAQEMAQRLFAGFPGESGATIGAR